MKNNIILFKAGSVIELSFATISSGKEAQVFNDYFPRVMPIVMELGGQPLCSFSITKSKSKMGSPKMGALFQWPTTEVFEQLHRDPRFLAIKGIRDEAMDFFSNGHFFVVEKDTEVVIQEGQTYGLQAHSNKIIDNSSLLILNPLRSNKYEKSNPHTVTLDKFDTSQNISNDKCIDSYHISFNF